MTLTIQVTNQNVVDVWCPASEYSAAYNNLVTQGCIQNIEVHPLGAGQIWVRGYGPYSQTVKVIPGGGPTTPGQFRVTNSLGTYAQWWPDWDAPNMPGGFLAKDTLLNVITMIAIRDERWLLLEKNKGWVNLVRCVAVPPPTQ
jgi:hypothetical protein